MIYQHLFDSVKEPATVRVGLVGAGDFGASIVTQSPHIPRLEVSAVADIDIEAGKRAYQQAGNADEDIAVCDSRSSALRAVESGRSVVVQDASLLMDLPLDVIATATRVPEAGARYASEAIQHGKHVVCIDKETDSVIGLMLKALADRAGVVFTTDDGDQPGLLMGLVSWARSLGFEILCGGNLHDCLYDPAASTVHKRGRTVQVSEKDRWALGRIPAGEARRYAQARRELLASCRPDEQLADPTCHMAVAANGTGLMPDVPAGHRTALRLAEIPEVFCPVEDGGILETRGAIDNPAILHTVDQPPGGGGVFVVIANADAHSRQVMIRKGLITNTRGTAMLVYRPYHLCGAETAMSILCAGLLQVPTGSATVLPRVDIVARAARDYRAGELFGTEGATGFGFDQGLRASLAPARPVGSDQPIPFFMLYGNRLAHEVPTGTVITCDMIEEPGDSILWKLRRQQDEHFFA